VADGHLSDPLEQARLFLRQGLLDEAGAVLATLPADSPAALRAPAALLTGNIAYERGHYDQARAAWQSAQSLYAEADAGTEFTHTVQANLALADERLARRALLQDESGTLRLLVAAALLVAVALLAVAYRRSAPAGRRPDGAPAHRPRDVGGR
jgi:hypothetical protein